MIAERLAPGRQLLVESLLQSLLAVQRRIVLQKRVKSSKEAPVAERVAVREALLEPAELAKKWKRQELRGWRQVACMDDGKL